MICVRYVEKAKEIAKKKGIAFTHISTELGKSRGYLSEMLANGRDLPEHMLADVASLLGVTVADLRGNTENEKKPTAQSDFTARFTARFMRPVVLALIDFLNEGFRTPNFIKHHNLI